MKYSFQALPSVKNCCKDSDNLNGVRERPDFVVYTCKVCECKHRVLTVDPGVLGAKLSPLGSE